MLCWPQEESCNSQTVTTHPDFPSCLGGDQTQVHWHRLQWGTWSLPDHPGEDEVLRSYQELRVVLSQFFLESFMFWLSVATCLREMLSFKQCIAIFFCFSLLHFWKTNDLLLKFCDFWCFYHLWKPTRSIQRQQIMSLVRILNIETVFNAFVLWISSRNTTFLELSFKNRSKTTCFQWFYQTSQYPKDETIMNHAWLPPLKSHLLPPKGNTVSSIYQVLHIGSSSSIWMIQVGDWSSNEFFPWQIFC